MKIEDLLKGLGDPEDRLTMSEEMGISKERFNELQKIVTNTFFDHDLVSSSLTALANQLTSLKELVLSGYLFYHYRKKLEARNDD